MRRLAAVLTLLLVVAACSDSDDATTTTVPADPTTTTVPTTTLPPETTTTTEPPPPTTQPPTVIPTGLGFDPFGDFNGSPLLDDAQPYAGPSTPTSLSDVLVYEPTQAAVANPALRAALEAQGFGVVPGEARLFHHVYSLDEYLPYPVFVTTDAAFHAWHLAFDKVLRDAEEEFLLPALERLMLGLVDRGRALRDQLAGTELADAADRAAQFYEAAATVLQLDVGAIGPLAQAEVDLVMEAAQFTDSPITSFAPCGEDVSSKNCVNYALFKPRGHYTRSADLERFFRGMSVLGNGAFFLDAESLRLGIVASNILLGDADAVADWQLIYEPTAFLVGAADDYTPFDLAAVAADVTPGGIADLNVFADDALVADLADGLLQLRQVAINPEASSVRIMGVRLTLDSFILDQLVDPSVPGRFVASVRDVAAAFGSSWAIGSLEADGYTAYAGYDIKLDEMRSMVLDRTLSDWGRTVYDAWLYAIEPVWLPHGEAYPDFMQSSGWAAKAHQTGFASYAELKHDTILYTKQAIAEGGNGEPPPPPRHWVEPEPVVYERIGAAATLLREGLEARGLINAGNAYAVNLIEDKMAMLARIARDELAGLPISPEDNQDLQSFGHWLEAVWLNTSDLDRIGEDGGPDEDAALVADVLTSAFEGALEVATGKVDTIYVLVPTDDGTFQVATGGVYSFYEFWQDPSNRLNDDEWRALLDAGDAPDRPSWADVFLAEP